MSRPGHRISPPTPQSLPFDVVEYRTRIDAVRALMAVRSIDLLYVTSPANLCYLTGYQAIWYPNRLPVGAVLERSTGRVVMLDWTRHESYVSTQVLCDEAVLVDYADAIGTVTAAFVHYGWTGRRIGVEWHASNPAAPVLAALAESLRGAGSSVESGDWLIDQVRLYKSPAEIERIRRAATMADHAMLQLQAALRPGLTELEVSALLTSLLAACGSEVPATPPLVNSGPTAWSDTHAFPTRRVLRDGDVVSVDCCAVIDRYHANLARTFAIGPANARATALLEQAAGSLPALQAEARLGEGPEAAAAVARAYVQARVPLENIWWVGGYSLGIAFPPSWVGHCYLANDGVEKCQWRVGFVSNYENVFTDAGEGFEAGCIDTLVMSERGLEALSRIPRALLRAG